MAQEVLSSLAKQLKTNGTAKGHLQRVNEEIYKRNAELAVKNKTLSLLRQLYEITTLTLETDELARRLVESIRTTLNFRFVGMLVVDKTRENLIPFAASFPQNARESIPKEHIKTSIPLSSRSNIYTTALQNKAKQQTEDLSAILSPFIKESPLQRKSTRVQTTLVYPLLTENKELGVLTFALRKQAKDLSFFERESIASLVNVAAVALDKALLYEALRNANVQLQTSIQKETEQRKELEGLTGKLEKTNAELKILDEAKSEFVSIASHQLRTPLTAIKGYISMILEGTYGKLPIKQQKPVSNIYESNERLIRLVNDLLNISRIESGKIKMEWEKAQLQKVTQSVIDELQIKAKEKNLKLTLKKPKTTLPLFSMDIAKVRNIILNIIDNAIHYTEKGSITVNLQSQKENVLITITDTGEGMSAEELGQLFESFSRGRAGNKMWTEGAGLGLYIAHQFVQMHKGKIWADSPGKGKGSIFSIQLPVQ